MKKTANDVLRVLSDLKNPIGTAAQMALEYGSEPAKRELIQEIFYEIENDENHVKEILGDKGFELVKQFHYQNEAKE